MINAVNQKVGLPPHTGPWLDWVRHPNLYAAVHGGAAPSFSYMFPVIKYAEAYTSMTGPGWGGYATYLNYNHGNQPYDYKDAGFNATRTPTTTAHIQLPLLKNSVGVGKTSTAGTQLAQQQIGAMLASRSPGMIPFM